MLNHPTHARLIELGLSGMAKAFEEQRRSPDLEALPFEDRIGLLVDREAAERDTRRLTHAPQAGRAAPECLCGGCRFAHASGPRPRRLRQTHQR
jgi:hypothetical protein